MIIAWQYVFGYYIHVGTQRFAINEIAVHANDSQSPTHFPSNFPTEPLTDKPTNTPTKTPTPYPIWLPTQTPSNTPTIPPTNILVNFSTNTSTSTPTHTVHVPITDDIDNIWRYLLLLMLVIIILCCCCCAYIPYKYQLIQEEMCHGRVSLKNKSFCSILLYMYVIRRVFQWSLIELNDIMTNPLKTSMLDSIGNPDIVFFADPAMNILFNQWRLGSRTTIGVVQQLRRQ